MMPRKVSMLRGSFGSAQQSPLKNRKSIARFSQRGFRASNSARLSCKSLKKTAVTVSALGFNVVSEQTGVASPPLPTTR